MAKRSSLQHALTLFTSAMMIVALVVCTALIIITTWLHQSSATLADSVESVRLAQEVQIDLLVHERSEDPLERERLEGELLRRLDEMRGHIVTNESAPLAEAERTVGTYVTVARAGPVSAELRSSAHRALEALVRSTIVQSQEARADASRLDRRANILGVTTGGVLLVLAALILWWVRRSLEPIVALAKAIRSFARGDWGARAEERGPTELQTIAVRFNEMADLLSSRRREQVAFLGAVAHDLRNPIGVVAMSVGVLAPEGTMPPESTIRRTAAAIRRQVARLDRMVHDILDMMRIEDGHLNLEVEDQDLNPIVHEVVEQFVAATADRHIHADITKTPIRVKCDAMRVGQILSNLVSNAIKYSPPHRDVDVTLDCEGNDAILSVTDHGIGMSSDDQERLFEPFRRVGLSKETIPGVGLGLFIVHKLVEAHGGRIDVESSLGRGSTFRVIMPLTKSARDDAMPSRHASGRREASVDGF